MTTKNLKTKAMQAAEIFLTRNKGWKIQERNWDAGAGEIDLIATDEDGTIHFVEVAAKTGDFPAEKETTAKRRARLERIAGSYLASMADLPECSVTFDILSLAVFGNNRAMLKLYSNVLSCANVA